MTTWMLSAIARPFVLFIFAYCVLYPARMAVMRYFPEGKIKRVLLFRVSDADSYRRRGRGKIV